MAKVNKRRPQDYPIFAIRLSDEDKAAITAKLDELYDRVNSEIGEDQYKVRKNEILVEAIFLGFQELKKRGYKRFVNK